MLKIEAFRMRRQKWNRIVRRLMSLFYPVLKITCTVIHFHTSNFIPPALRQFYSIAIFPLKSFSSFALSRSSSSSFPLSSCPTFSLAHLHLHLPISPLSPLLLYSPSRFLSITIPVPFLPLLFALVTLFRLHESLPSRAVLVLSFSRFLSPIASFLSFSSSLLLTLRWSSLCLAWSLLVALTARNQYVPLHGLCPYHEPSSPNHYSWSWPTNPTTLCYPYYTFTVFLYSALYISIKGGRCKFLIYF